MLTRKPNEPQKYTVQIRFTLDRKKLVDLPISVDFQNGLRHRNLAQVSGLTVFKPGVLRAALRFNNKILGTWMIEITDTGQTPHITPITKQAITQQAPTPPKPKAKKAKKKSSRILRAPAPSKPKAKKAKKKSSRKLRAATAGTPKARKGGKKSRRKPRSS